MSYTFVWKHVWAPIIDAVKGEAMANQEQLEILEQGVEVWNKWRDDHSFVEINLAGAVLGGADFSRANLSGADLKDAIFSRAILSRANLSGADLRDADLIGADLIGADLSRAYLIGAYLIGANLIGANLIGAFLDEADLSRAYLHGADLSRAYLHGANLRNADLSRANLSGANLSGADFSRADLSRADLTGSAIMLTIFGNNDLSTSIGLETIKHIGPSTIGTNTLQRSKGKIPIEFLRGCGLRDWEIQSAKLYDLDLSPDEIDTILYRMHDLRAGQALQISPLFISYSHADDPFVNKVGDCLTEKGIRFWRDIHNAKAGRLEKQIDRAIRLNPTVLLVLSEHSIKSDWVEHEVRTARELEKELSRDTLCPVALDDSWKSSPWPKRVMEQVMEYNILDFSEWEDDSKFYGMFRRLIDGLELFYKG